jgi:leucyl/phenylalanyl-tRNA--protein transferase
MELTPEVLIGAYCQGIFPMPDEFGVIAFYEPDPRAIIPLDAFHVPRRLGRTVRSGRFEVRYDTDFAGVIRGCAEPARGRETTWISDEMMAAYTRLYGLGFVHTVECWHGGCLVGGLYGVAIRGLFAAESKFSRARDASKVALVHLVRRLKAGGFTLLDTQYMVNDHMRQFGTMEVAAEEYRHRLARALSVRATF